jgi:hypothetical protein
MQRMLVIRGGAVGDLIVTLPTLGPYVGPFRTLLSSFWATQVEPFWPSILAMSIVLLTWNAGTCTAFLASGQLSHRAWQHICAVLS